MSAGDLAGIFDALARSMGAQVRQSEAQPGLRYIDLQMRGWDHGRVRLCVDCANAVAIVRTALPFSAVLSSEADQLEQLLAVYVRLSPAQSGKRLYPELDMRAEHIALSYVLGADVIRNAQELALAAQACAVESARLITEARQE